MRKRDQKEFRAEKVTRRKGDKLYVKRKGYENSFNSWIEKKRYRYIKLVIFLDHILVVKKKVELDLPNYATKSDLKITTGVDTSNFAKKADLASLKSDIDKLDTN